ncbi:unnamed protein product [Nesidiocoris tenuis]|uniref:Uncharacterized protein n=2 Tax=Nesidiocoris tenuis TaxID=355587 RepID=A0A6H5HQU4_9HEMI|nr:Hypothetical protein NTJ_14312 [Nesidiocoris tenuis]CAB0019295.1 unnamed protein product [Nesidiocoris tenuis]
MRIAAAIFLLAVSTRYYGDGKIYKPCELAQEAYKIFITSRGARADEDPNLRALTQYLDDIPLIVCIAGYHNFNTSNEYSLGDGHYREGLFGIVRHAGAGSKKRNRFLDDDISNDIFELIHVLYVGSYSNNVTHKFYASACHQPSRASYVYCYLNEYVFGSYPVLVPNNPDFLVSLYQNPRL